MVRTNIGENISGGKFERCRQMTGGIFFFLLIASQCLGHERLQTEAKIFNAPVIGLDLDLGLHAQDSSYRETIGPPSSPLHHHSPGPLSITLAPYLATEWYAAGWHLLAASYSYRQDWHTSEGLLRLFPRAVFPLPMMVRTHRADFVWRYRFDSSWQFGLWGEAAVQRMGSRWGQQHDASADPRTFSSPVELRRSLTLAPWLQYRWTPRIATQAALYLHAVDLDDYPDLSYRTFALGAEAGRGSVLLRQLWQTASQGEPLFALTTGLLNFSPFDAEEVYYRWRLGFSFYPPLPYQLHLEASVQRFWDTYPYATGDHRGGTIRRDQGEIYHLDLSQDGLLPHLRLGASVRLVRDAHPAKNVGEFLSRDVMLYLSWQENPQLHKLLHPPWLAEEYLIKRAELKNSVFP